jgi:hypothetical protein
MNNLPIFLNKNNMNGTQHVVANRRGALNTDTIPYHKINPGCINLPMGGILPGRSRAQILVVKGNAEQLVITYQYHKSFQVAVILACSQQPPNLLSTELALLSAI